MKVFNIFDGVTLELIIEWIKKAPSEILRKSCLSWDWESWAELTQRKRIYARFSKIAG